MATKKTPLTEDTLIAMYMDYTLAHHENQNLFINSPKLMAFQNQHSIPFLEHYKVSKKRFLSLFWIKPQNY